MRAGLPCGRAPDASTSFINLYQLHFKIVKNVEIRELFGFVSYQFLSQVLSHCATLVMSILTHGRLAHLVERSLRMREVLVSIPRSSMMNIRRSHIVQSATSLGVFQERFLETIPVSTRRGNPEPEERMSYSNRLVIFACCRCAPSYTLSYQLSGSERQTILPTVVPDSLVDNKDRTCREFGLLRSGAEHSKGRRKA